MFHSLQNHLQLSHAKAMGYHSEEKFAQALKAFKAKNTLIEWFDSRFYDMVHFPQSFYLKASEVLGVDESKVREEMDEATKHIEDRKNYGTNVFIHTQTTLDELKDKGANAFTLMGAKNQKTLHIQDIECFVLKPQEEVLKLYKQIIQEHCKANNAEIPQLGKILGYSVKIWGKEFHFSPQGEVIEKLESVESPALN